MVRRSILLFLIICLSAVGSAVAIGSPASDAKGNRNSAGPVLPPAFDPEHSDLLPAQAHDFASFRLYSVGESFEGHALKAITRRVGSLDAGDRSGHADFVNFIYGDCQAKPDSGCAPPLEVQIWPACQRSRSSYELTPDGRSLPRRDASVRAAPAAWFEGDQRLEIYTGNVTVVMFGDNRGQLARAAAALRGVNHGLREDAPLPPPAAGALKGEISC